MADGSLWADPERARQTVAEVKSLKGWLEPYHALRKRVDEGRELNELLAAETHIDLALQLVQLTALIHPLAQRVVGLEPPLQRFDFSDGVARALPRVAQAGG